MTVWDCKIGTLDDVALELGSDFPMRQAIRDAYRQLTGCEPEFLFSGWGASLIDLEESVVTEDAARRRKENSMVKHHGKPAPPRKPQPKKPPKY